MVQRLDHFGSTCRFLSFEGNSWSILCTFGKTSLCHHCSKSDSWVADSICACQIWFVGWCVHMSVKKSLWFWHVPAKVYFDSNRRLTIYGSIWHYYKIPYPLFGHPCMNRFILFLADFCYSHQLKPMPFRKKKNPARRSKVSCVWRGMKLRRGFVGESQIERAKEPGIFHGNFPY